MNRLLSRYCFYYPATLLKGERVARDLRNSRNFQWSSRRAVDHYQLKKALEIARCAAAGSEFYRRLYAGADLNRIKSLDDFKVLPIVGKSDLIAHEKDMRTACTTRSEEKTTGGSTGQPVRVLKNVDALSTERAATWRAYEWAGVSVGDPQGRFWGVPHTRKGRLKAAVTDWIANRKRISAFDLTTESLSCYYRQLAAFRPAYLYGYVSVLEALARHIDEQGLAPIPGVKSVITTSEVLYPGSRELIQNAFGVKVFNEYGCGEVGSIAHECEHGRMHIMADNLLVEIAGDNAGDIIVTDFHNRKMPLVRYRVGDYGRLSEENCPCGRKLPVLSDVYGRAYDLIRLKNGIAIHPESLIYVVEDFKDQNDSIAQFQAVQRSYDELELLILPKPGWTNDIAEGLIRKMQANLSSQLTYAIHLVENIHRETSGKMRLVKSEVEAEAPA